MGANEVRAGRAYVEAYTKDSTGKGLEAIFGKFTAFGKRLAAIGGLAIGGITTSVPALAVMKAVERGSAVKDASDRTGLAYSAIQELGYAAGQTATDMGELESGIKLMQKTIGTGGKEVEQLFKSLGLDFGRIQAMSPDQQFMQIAGAISQIGDPAQRVTVAMKIFGRSGQSLIPLLNEGAVGIERMRARARELGLVMSDADVEAAEALGDRVAELRMQFDAMQSKIGIALLPAAEALIEKLQEIAPLIQQFATDLGHVIVGLDQVQPSSQETLGGWLKAIGLDEFGSNMIQGAQQTAEFARRDLEAERRRKQVAADAQRAMAASKLARTGSEVRESLGSTGSFDARDFAGGIFKDELKKQSDLLKSIDDHVQENGRKPFGIPGR